MAGEHYRGGQDGALQNKSISQSACIQCLSTPDFSPDRVSCTLPLPLWLKTIPALVKNKYQYLKAGVLIFLRLCA